MRSGILVVDAERGVATELQQTLATLGYDAYAIATSADEALARAHERAPDLVLMDIHITGELDGIDAAHRLRRELAFALVYLTADADDATLARAKETEPHGYLLKPAGPAALRSTIEMALHKHQVEQRALARQRWLAEILPELDATVTRRLEIADRLASLGTLAAGVAHEVNNPLSVVVANATYVADELARVREERGPDPGLDEAIVAQGELLGAADRIAQIIGDMRDVAKPPQGADARADVAAAVARAVRATAGALRDRARVITEIGPVPAAPGDESRLTQVLVNLLLNAAHACPPGGVIGNTVHVRAHTSDDGGIALEVTDTGAGIAPDILPRVFEPFFTTKPIAAGTGLGLAVCRGIMTSLGGAITATSTLGQGTTIRLRLPSAIAPRPSPARSASIRARVLVIDDDELVRRALGRMLRDHDVTTARGAAEGLALIAGAREFDVIITDIAMPDMTGIELFEHLRATRPAVARRLVFLSGAVVAPQTRAFFDTVPNAHVEKPVRGAILQEVIAKVMERTA